jgi:hypothetical protein
VISSLVLRLAGKRVLGQPFTEDEKEALEGLVNASDECENPIHVWCTIGEHKSWGVIVFLAQIGSGAIVGNIRLEKTGSVCIACGDNRHVVSEPIDVFSP